MANLQQAQKVCQIVAGGNLTARLAGVASEVKRRERFTVLRDLAAYGVLAKDERLMRLCDGF